MIRSIQFTGKGKNDYITQVKYKEVYKEGLSQEEIDEIRKRTHSRGREWEEVCKTVEDGYRNPQLIENLLNRKFEFSPNKINVLFGPNGSGKTTIMRALAAYSLCGAGCQFDGMTNLLCYSPENMDTPIWKDEDTTYRELFYEAMDNQAKNQAIVDWDGYPVYYENTAGRKYYSIGDMEGGLCEDLEDEIQFTFGGKSSSSGQNTIWMINKLTAIAIRKPNIQQLIDLCNKRIKNVNDIWANCYKENLAYFKEKIANSDLENNRLTVLLDEMDKSLDILNVTYLYKEVLPQLVKKYPLQLIIVTHSPLILTKNIRESDSYNIISVDEKYTSKVLNNLKGFEF